MNRDTLATAPENTGQKQPQFKSPEEKTSFTDWSAAVAAEVDFMSPGEPNDHEVTLRILIGDEEAPGDLYPNGLGYPSFYDYPFTEQKSAEDGVYRLYASAFRVVEHTEHECGREAAYLRTYVTVDVADKGQISAAGVLTARKPIFTHEDRSPGSFKPVTELPDRLAFHQNLIYIEELACESEGELLDFYRRITASRIRG